MFVCVWRLQTWQHHTNTQSWTLPVQHDKYCSTFPAAAQIWSSDQPGPERCSFKTSFMWGCWAADKDASVEPAAAGRQEADCSLSAVSLAHESRLGAVKREPRGVSGAICVRPQRGVSAAPVTLFTGLFQFVRGRRCRASTDGPQHSWWILVAPGEQLRADPVSLQGHGRNRVQLYIQPHRREMINY